MTQKKRLTIGVLIELLEGNYQSIVWPGIVETAKENDCNLILFPGKETKKSVRCGYQHEIAYKFITANKLDGLVCTSSVFTNYYGIEGAIEFFQQFEPIPMAHMGMKVEGSIGVAIENKQGICEAVEHLITMHGHSKIAFIQGPMYNNEAQDRYQGYLDTLEKFNLPFDSDLVVNGDFLVPSGYAAIAELLGKRKVKPDAIVAANDEMALGVLQAMKERGLHSPKDIAVTGFDAIDQTRYHIPSLTTIKAPLYEQAKLVTQLLINKIKGENVPELVTLPAKLIVRQTCGCLSPSVESLPKIQDHLVASVTTAQQDKEIQNALSQIFDHFSLDATVYGMKKVEIEELRKLVDYFFDGQNNPELQLRNFSYELNCLLIKGIEADDDVDRWAHFFNHLKEEVFRKAGHILPTDLTEKIFQHTNLLIEEFRFLARSAASVKSIAQLNVLSTVNNDLMTTFDLEKLMGEIEDTLPRLGIDQFFISLYEDPMVHYQEDAWDLPETIDLVLAHDENGRLEPENGINQYHLNEIVPESIPLSEPYSLVLKPLFFEETQFGFIGLKMGHRDSMVYEILRVQISSAIRGSLLFNQEKKLKNDLQTAHDQLKETNLFLQKNKDNLEEKSKTLHLTNQALADAERKSRFLLESSPDYIMAVDLEHRIEYINRSVVGKSIEKAAGEFFYDFVYPHLIEKLVDAIKKTIKKKQHVDFEHEIQMGENSIWFEYRLTPVIEGAKSQVMIIARDITQRKDTEKQLAEAQKELVLKAHQAGMADIATGALHNVGNVLNSVKTSAQAIQNVLQGSELPGFGKTNDFFQKNLNQHEIDVIGDIKIKQFLEYYCLLDQSLNKERSSIKEQLERLDEKIELIVQIIAAQQKYAGATYLSNEESLESVINDALVLQEESLRNYGITVQREFQSIPNISFQKAKLIHILINVINNAKDAMSKTPKEKRHFNITLISDADNVYLKFKDSGEGLSKDQLSLIFSHGYTTKKDGFGFGLHSCANYMTEMNGSMWAESDGPGTGATMVLSFPIHEKVGKQTA